MANTGDTKTCPFCNTLAEELWYCSECKINFCWICSQNIHTKITSNLNHNVYKLDPEISNGNENRNITEVKCSQHADQSCFAICKHCTKCLCPDCIEKPNEEICAGRKAKLEELQEKIDKDLPLFLEDIEKLEQFKEKCEGKYGKIKDEILNKKEAMKDNITGLANKLIEELDDWWEPTKNTITKEAQRLKKAEIDLNEQKSIIKNALSSDDSVKIFEASDRVIRKIPAHIPALEIKQPKSIRFSIETSTKSLCLGSFNSIPELKLVQSRNCDVTDILHSVDENLLLGYNADTMKMNYFVLTTDYQCYNTKKMTFYRNYSDSTSAIRSLTTSSINQIMSTTNSYSDNAIYTCVEKNNEYYYSSLFCLNPLIAISIHHDKKGRILVGYMDKVSYTLSENSHRGIMVYNNEHKTRTEIELDREKHKPFTFPKAITTNYNGDICVIDKIKKDDGRIVVLDKWGGFKWEYDGKLEGQSDVFLPEHVTTSPKGFIFVSDWKGNKVHMLSQDGVFLTSLGESDGIIEPSGLTIYKGNLLLIGCPGKLYIVEIED